MSKSKFFDQLEDNDLKKEAIGIKVIGPVRFIIYKQQKTQKERDKMWAEALAAFRSNVPVVFINDYANAGYIRYVKKVCKKTKFLKNTVHITFTSGSTGKPKLVQSTDQMLLFAAKNHISAMKLKKNYVFADFRNPDYIPGFIRFVVAQKLGAKYIYIDPALDPASIISRIQEDKIDFFSASANYWFNICQILEKKKMHLNLKVAHISGKIIPYVVDILKKYSNCRVYFTYASSETGLIAIKDPKSIRKKPASAGMPVPGVRIDILDEMGKKCKPFEEGEITVSSKFIAPPYASPYRTGDIGYKDADGELYIVGRKDSRLRISGYRINAEQLEAAYNKYPVLIFGVPDGKTGNHNAAAVFETEDPIGAVRDYVASVEPPMNAFCFPRYIFRMRKLPRIDNGKIDAQKVKKMFEKEILKIKNR